MWRAALKGLFAKKLRLLLTAASIVLGVGFVAGTYVLTDTMARAFDQLFATVASDTDVVVRAASAFEVTGQGAGGDGTSGRRPIPASVLETVRAVQGVAEALHFAKRAGLPTDDVLAAISKGSAQSWQMENRWKTMSEGQFDFGFAVDWMRKDLGIALAEAAVNGAKLEGTALIDGFYEEVQAMGGHRWDTSSLVARLET